MYCYAIFLTASPRLYSYVVLLWLLGQVSLLLDNDCRDERHYFWTIMLLHAGWILVCACLCTLRVAMLILLLL